MTAPIKGVIETYKRHPIEFASGHGATLVDSNGKEYIDLLGGIAVASVGHAHPYVAEAIAEQARTLLIVSNYFTNAPMVELAARLHNLTGMDSFFCNSGAEAVECALKLIRRWAGVHKPGATRVICADAAFHGRTFGALAATGQPKKKEPFAPMLEGFTHVPFGDAAALAAAMGPDVGAIMLEPIQGEAGVVVPPDDYLAAARSLCDEHGALFVLDEIQTGLGRTGKWFAHDHYGVKPDIMLLAKALGAGLPIGACLATSEVASAFQLGDHGTTFGGGPVPCAAAIAVLDVIEKEGLVERSEVLGQRLQEGAARAFPNAVEVRGKGLMIAVVLDRDAAAEVVSRALEAGVIVNNPADNIVRMVPPLVITEAQIDSALKTLGEVWASITDA